MSSELAPHVALPEPMLAFRSDRASDRDIHPLRGLLRCGPYSTGLVPDPIRVATLAPAGESGRLFAFMKTLNSEFRPKERIDYLPAWPGFRRVFGLRMEAATKSCHVELDAALDGALKSGPRPHLALAEALARYVQNFSGRTAEFEVLFIFLPARWERAYSGGEVEDFDLHDYIKAMCAAWGVPVQLVREDKALSYPDRASVMWRIGLALYVKAGGVPWTIADADPETAHIGVSYALRAPDATRPRFVTCCSQIFDAEGRGPEFIAYDAEDVDVKRDNPFLSRTEMFRVMARSMDLYRRRHAGRSPRNVVVHKTTEFKRAEVDGCFDAFQLCDSVDLVQVVEDVGWRGVRIEEDVQGRRQGVPASYPVARGTLLGLGPRDALLWTHGDVSRIAEKGSYFQGSRSTPRPLRLVRHAGHGTWDKVATSILALSKMNWNNDALYDQLPVTLGFAKTLARVVKRMSVLKTTPYQFKYFM